jgi:hypothetical protein
MVLMSCDQLRLMNSYIVWQSMIAVGLQWLLGARFGVSGIFIGAALSFLMTASWILPRRVLRIARESIG